MESIIKVDRWSPKMKTKGTFLAWILCFGLVLAAHPLRIHADVDVGNIAVIEAGPTILQPGELFDLNNTSVTFTPKAGGGYTVTAGALNFDTDTGTNLGLGDDDNATVALGFSFPFFGASRSSAFVNSNGYITFGSASTNAHFNGQSGGNVTTLGSADTVLDLISGGFPRIAVLWQDWVPSSGGSVLANSLADRLVVTWNGIPLFGTTTTAVFQVVLFNSGVIRMNYQSVATTPGGGYLVGISRGSLNKFMVTTLDFSTGSGSSISSFPNFEPLAQVFGSSSAPLLHVSAVSRKFLQSHPDGFDQLVVFANFTHSMGNAFAFELTINQTVSGIGLGPTNVFSFFGSSGKLQSLLNMNRLALYPADPNTDFLGTNNTLDLMGQESGHMWLAYVDFDDGGVCSNLLLGRALAHWSFFHDSDASDMEGNKWQDNGNGTFTTIEATERFSALDQYIMGIKAAADVPNFFFINNPTDTTKTSSSAPQTGVTITGTRKDVTLNQVITCEGSRSPSSGYSGINPTTTWKQAFILLVPAGTTAPSSDTTKTDTIRAAWEPYFSTAVGGRGVVDTTLPSSSTFTLTVVKSGTGSGTVTSSPAGISCGADCSESYASGTGATLTAAASGGSTFGGWSGGGCSGTGTCAVTMNSDITITATFTAVTGSASLVAAVLPSSRSVQVGVPATAFATIINVGPDKALVCGLSPITSIPANFIFQTTNPATNQVTGTPNTPIDILAGVAQSFVFAFIPTAPINSTDVQLSFDCANSSPAAIQTGLNTLLFSASATPTPDIVALAATINNDGIVNIPGATGTGVFAVATVNVGANGTITVTADTGSASLAVSIAICETNPTTGQCVNPTVPTTNPVVTTIPANATPTFGIFVQGTGNVAFDPATNRIFVRFKDSAGVTRGSTSVAVRTQ